MSAAVEQRNTHPLRTFSVSALASASRLIDNSKRDIDAGISLQAGSPAPQMAAG
jgi:hypothetical protein